jgi:phage-related protein
MCYHRLICLIIAGQMILLHGFTKKIPQIPKRDLDLAQVRKAEVERSGEETQP